MVGLLAGFRTRGVMGGASPQVQTTCLICISRVLTTLEVHRWAGPDPDSPLGKPGIAQFLCTVFGIQAQGWRSSLGSGRDLYGFSPQLSPHLVLSKAFLFLCSGGPGGFFLVNAKLVCLGPLFVATGKGLGVCLSMLVSHASLTAGKLISSPYLNY